MATSISPITLDVSDSDSEPGTNYNSQTHSQDEAVFTNEWCEDDFPQSAYDLLDVNTEVDTEEKDVSVSSADTEIYTPQENYEIVWEDTPVKDTNNQKSGKTLITTKENVKIIKDQQKLEKKKLREEKKAEEQKQKRLRTALLQHQRNLKPEENIKLLTVNIDTQVINSDFGGVVIASLQQAGIQYEVKTIEKGNIILWTKKIRDIIVNDEGVTYEDKGYKEENELFYLISAEKIIKLIQSNELLAHVQTVRTLYEDKCLTVVITKMLNFFEVEKRRINKKISNARKGNRNAEHHVNISMEDVQYALVELQVIGKFSHWFVETAEELASLITSTTKSLSQLNYKMEKQRQEEELVWFAKADLKHCVKVDKSGNGLAKLWQQQICQFTAIGIETANAITSHYPSPRALIDRYKICSSVTEGEKLLQNIQMRRDAGILSSTRRLGPEISKKMYQLYMTDDPDLEL